MADVMSLQQQDTLKELMNIGVGRAANTLNLMLGKHVVLQVPEVHTLNLKELKTHLQGFGYRKLSSVRLSFEGPFAGATSLIFPPDSAVKLVQALTNEEQHAEDLDAMRIGTLTEIGNIVVNSVMGSIANLVKMHLNYSLPDYREESVLDIVSTHNVSIDSTIILAQAHFDIRELHIEGKILLWFEVGAFDTLIERLDAMNADGDPHKQ